MAWFLLKRRGGLESADFLGCRELGKETGTEQEWGLRDLRGFKVWRKAHDLTLAVYQATRRFPKEELFGLTSQIRRSCESIPANIAEGCGRGGSAEFSRVLQIAMGSASELEYHLLLSRDLKILSGPHYGHLSGELIELKRMLTALIKKLRAESRLLALGLYAALETE